VKPLPAALLVAACLAGAPALWGQAALSVRGDPASGSRIFIERGCERCHSIWGNGGTLGPDFAVAGTGRSLQQLAGLFWNHTPRMIETVRRRGLPWPTFTEAELADLISYIYYVKLFDRPGDPGLGERWFREKRCGECHSLGGRGGRIGPALDSYARYIAPIVLAEGMWNSGAMMQTRQAALGTATPVFVGRELADIQAYIRQASSLRPRDVVMLEPPNPDAGRRLFAAKGCAHCHGAAGSGSASGPDLRAATQRLQVSEIAGRLWNHSAQMAAAMRARSILFPRFQGTEMADVIAYLYYLRFYETGGNTSAGELVFTRKGCATCHAEGGQAIGPALAGSVAARTPLALATAMWNHAPAMYDRTRMERVEWPRFEGEEMRDLSAYLQQLNAEGRRR
jgi:cytochrome c2